MCASLICDHEEKGIIKLYNFGGGESTEVQKQAFTNISHNPSYKSLNVNKIIREEDCEKCIKRRLWYIVSNIGP